MVFNKHVVIAHNRRQSHNIARFNFTDEVDGGVGTGYDDGDGDQCDDGGQREACEEDDNPARNSSPHGSPTGKRVGGIERALKSTAQAKYNFALSQAQSAVAVVAGSDRAMRAWDALMRTICLVSSVARTAVSDQHVSSAESSVRQLLIALKPTVRKKRPAREVVDATEPDEAGDSEADALGPEDPAVPAHKRKRSTSRSTTSLRRRFLL